MAAVGTRSILSAVAILLVAPTHAGAASDQDRQGPGDEKEERATLSERGIDLSFGYVNEWLHNIEGGDRRTSAYADQIRVSADMDFSRLVGWRGASFHVVVTNRNGPLLDAEAGLETLLQTHEIHGRGHYTRLTRFYLMQQLLDGRVIIKVGRGDVDFFPFTCDFINISFCGALPGYHSNGWYTWPIGQEFANVTLVAPGDVYLKFGANEVNPRNLDGDQGLRLTTPDDDRDGTLANVELGWTPSIGNGLVGAYRIGYWRDSTNYPDLLLNQWGQALPIAGGSPLVQDTSTGYYAMLEQQVTRNAREGGLVLFANLSRSETNVSPVDRLLSAGFWYKGLFTARPADRLGVAIGHNRVSQRIRDHEDLENELHGTSTPSRGSEKPVEVNYAVSIRAGLWMIPSVQLVRDPGGRPEAESALIVGFKVALDL